MGRLDEIVKAVGGAAPESKYIRAYHGSPYDFDRFDASKIGTGEGAQAYGHGLYFAGSEDVARSYRDSLKDMVDLPVPEELDGQLMQVIGEIGQLSGQRGKVVGGEWDVIQKQLDQKQNLLIDLQHRYREAAQNPGRMYEVEIARPEQALLDWDATLDEQQHLLPAAKRALGRIQDPLARHDAMGIIEEPAGNKGRDLYGILKAYAPESSRVGENARFASRALMEEGIPGLRYLDGLSRRVGEGTRNYVMFPGTEDSIRILRKYGIAAPIAAGAMQDQQ
jgi:hypothetical protein